MNRATKNTYLEWHGDKLTVAVHTAISNAVTKAGDSLKKKIHQNLSRKDNSSRMTPSKKGKSPAMVTGALRNSWDADFSLSKAPNPIVTVSSNLRYAAILEYGSEKYGRIKPKWTKFLTVPLNTEAAKKRVQYKDLRNMEGLFVLKEKGQRIKSGKRKGKRYKGRRGRDTLILAMTVGKGKNAKIKPMFALVKSVFISKRPYVRPALLKIKVKLNKKIAKSVSTEMQAVGRYATSLLSFKTS